MKEKTGVTSPHLLESVTQFIKSGGQIDDREPMILSCGGLFLKELGIPENLATWEAHLYLPNGIFSNVRVFRMQKGTSRRSLKRVLKLECFN